MISLLLCAVMLITMLPAQTMAMETEETEVFLEETESVPEETETVPEENTEPTTEETVAVTETVTEPTVAEEPAAAETTGPMVENVIVTEVAAEAAMGSAEVMAAAALAQGNCGDNLTWGLDDAGTLTISGKGEMDGFADSSSMPWYDHLSSITSVVLDDGVTGIGNYAFDGCTALSSVTIPGSVRYIAYRVFAGCTALKSVTMEEGLKSIGSAAFEECTALTSIRIPNSIKSIGTYAFYNCSRLSSVTLPEGMTEIGQCAFGYCGSLTEVTIPEKVTLVDTKAFAGCTGLSEITFLGDAPTFGTNVFSGITATVRYPAGNTTWTEDKLRNYGGTITWEPYDSTAYRVSLDAVNLAGYGSVWIDGVEYAVQTDGDNCYVDLQDDQAKTMVAYTYHIGDASDVHSQYPVGMKVWTLEYTDGLYTATYQPDFDNILRYSGMSIRVTGKKGIRMITSIEKDKKKAMVSGGLEGYTLKEYGTVVAWASQVDESNPLVLGKPYAKSNYAYKKGVADPVFAYDGDLMQYTNVLVNFSDEQCKNELALRPYMILKDANGKTLTIYGGIVYRSIGYIAYQNRDVFEPKTAEYNYIWDIIHYVYGDVYDDDFIHA